MLELLGWEVGGEAVGLSRSEWRGVRSERGRFDRLRDGCRRGTFWVPAFTGTTVGDGLRGEWGRFGGFGCFDGFCAGGTLGLRVGVGGLRVAWWRGFWVPAFAGTTKGAGCPRSGSVWADLPKPRLRSSRAAAMRWWGLKLLISPTITFTRKRAMERPSPVSSRINLASSVSNLVWCLEFGLSRLGDDSDVLSAMKLEASSLP